ASSAASAAVASPTIAVANLSGHIAFVGEPANGDPAQLFVARADGSSVAQITSDETAHFGLPSWSPDGKRLVFAKYVVADEIPVIWTANADGSGAAQLVDDTYAQVPSWSPDGSRIAYSRGDDTGQQGG